MFNQDLLGISAELKPAEYISFARLFQAIPMDAVKDALCATASNDKRERDLPNRYMAYFVIALSMFSQCSHQEVFRNLVETLKAMFGPMFETKIPAKSSITESRQRLGQEPFEHLFRNVVKPIAVPGRTHGAFFKGFRLVGIDGCHFLVPDTEANEREFGRAIGSDDIPAAYPAIRCVGLIELGTRILFEYEIGAAGGSKDVSEVALAKKLLPRLQNDQLCLADRLYGANFRMWRIAKDTGAHLLWRIRKDIRLDCEEVLPDGSYMSSFYDGNRKRKGAKSEKVRVIEFDVKHGSAKPERYRLITTLAHGQATLDELAELYHERWEYENTNKEHKRVLNAHLEGLRSKTPTLVIQELLGVFLAHFAIRSFMHEAALSANIDVDRLSFKHAISVIRRRAPQAGAFPP